MLSDEVMVFAAATRTSSVENEPDRLRFGVSLSGDSLVMLEQSAEPFAATDVTKRECRLVESGEFLRSLRPNEKFVFTPLMRPLVAADLHGTAEIDYLAGPIPAASNRR